jgi:DNA-directed RNA polymerase subunit K/omega
MENLTTRNHTKITRKLNVFKSFSLEYISMSLGGSSWPTFDGAVMKGGAGEDDESDYQEEEKVNELVDDDQSLDDEQNDETIDDDDVSDDEKIENEEMEMEKGEPEEIEQQDGEQQDVESDGESEGENESDSESEEEEDGESEDDEYLQKFDKDVRSNFLTEFHPESSAHNDVEVRRFASVVRNKDGDIIDDLHRTIPFLTKYEYTRIIGQRAKQIDSGALPFVEVRNDIIDGDIIAKMELEAKKIPFIIRRPMPGGGCEYWKLEDLEILH